MSGVVLDAGTYSGFPNHFHIKVGSFGNTLGLQKLFFALKIGHPLVQLFQNVFAGNLHFLHRNNVGGGREHHAVLKLCLALPGEGINQLDFLDFVSEKLDTVGLLSFGRGENVYDVPLYPEGSTAKIHIVSVVLDFHQVFNQFISITHLSGTEGNGHV